MSGPLAGIRVIEFAGVGPLPYCGMLLADMGADVVTIDRPGGYPPFPIVSRGKTSLVADLKTEAGKRIARDAIVAADVLIEGFRPGVMEQLGLGPDEMLALNDRLIFGRMTGWGQDGPLARTAGHDINYIAITGALDAIGFADRPAPPPLNLIGDLGGGALFLALGIAAALVERARSGRGQVIDAAIVDGTASLLGSVQGMANQGRMTLDRGAGLLGGKLPNYRCYRCADGREIAVGALEPHFRDLFLSKLGLDGADIAIDDHDAETAHTAIAERIATKTRDEWCRIFEGSDACVTPVLTIDEAIAHPHNIARVVHVPAGGGHQPAPAPRFSRTQSRIAGGEPRADEGGAARLAAWGVRL